MQSTLAMGEMLFRCINVPNSLYVSSRECEREVLCIRMYIWKYGGLLRTK